MLLFLEHTFLLLSHPSFTTKVFPAFLRCCRHPAAANPVGEDISGVLVTPSGAGTKTIPCITMRLVEIRMGKTWYSHLTSVLDPLTSPPYVVADLQHFHLL